MSLTLAGPEFNLLQASEPFPTKLLEKIRAGHFVEMWDLLTDNISLIQQMEALNGQCTSPALPGMLKPHLREVSSLSSWTYCFLAYVAIRSQEPKTQDTLAYAQLLIREAQRHDGGGWLDYDRVFQQQAAIDPSLQWNTLHPGIQAATMVRSGSGSGTFCTLCRGSDHQMNDCALAYLQGTPATESSTNPSARPSESRGTRAPASFQAPATIGTSVHPVTSVIRLGTAPRLQNNPSTRGASQTLIHRRRGDSINQWSHSNTCYSIV